MTTLSQPATATSSRRFTTDDANTLYSIPNWGSRYFSVKEGKLHVSDGNAPSVALASIVEDLREQGHALPLILRFPQIIEHRISRLNEAFIKAADEAGYTNRYQGVYPIKVNQRRVVVETIAEYGEHYRTGLEAGSKAELALCLVQNLHPEALLCCNGFKDDDFIRLALWGRKLGKNVVITLEKHSELERVLRIAEELNVSPAIGIRFKLHTRGSGKWESSGGDDAKFGLTATEVITAASRLKALGMADALQMLHCHVGSQITDIRNIKNAVREAAQAFTQLVKSGVSLRYLNVGGGLAVDYDGSKTTFFASANYGIQEYADTVVYTVQEVCRDASVAEPILVSESGRALTAHHAVVVLPVIDAIGPTREPVTLPPLEDEPHALVRDMRALLENITVKTYREVYNEAVGNKETMHSLFDLGYLGLLERAHIETLFNRILVKVAQVTRGLEYVSDEFDDLPKLLADKYVCNFSLFQSLPDHWAIGALFPITPLTRLDERPSRDATLVDISCDSDGKVTQFVDLRDVKATLPLHELREGEPYYLGIFLTGAYQDVLANAHNLFGRVNEAHVRLDDESYTIERFVKGQKARRVIENMGYEAAQLRDGLRQGVAEAQGKYDLSGEEAADLLAIYDAELTGYTYLEEL